MDLIIKIVLGLLTIIMPVVLVFASIAVEIANKVMRWIYEDRSCKH